MNDKIDFFLSCLLFRLSILYRRENKEKEFHLQIDGMYSCVLDYFRMYSSSNSMVKLFDSVQPIFRKTSVRTLLNPFASKPVEKAKDAHSNLLTDTKNVFELQQHTVQSRSMVTKKSY